MSSTTLFNDQRFIPINWSSTIISAGAGAVGIGWGKVGTKLNKVMKQLDRIEKQKRQLEKAKKIRLHKIDRMRERVDKATRGRNKALLEAGTQAALAGAVTPIVKKATSETIEIISEEIKDCESADTVIDLENLIRIEITIDSETGEVVGPPVPVYPAPAPNPTPTPESPNN